MQSNFSFYTEEPSQERTEELLSEPIPFPVPASEGEPEHRPGCAKTEFILIDYENVQPKSLGGLDKASVAIKVFVGANQTKVLIDFANELQPFGKGSEYIQIKESGKDALDFHIAYWIGRLSVKFPGAIFRIISKDTGFDPLIRYLEASEVRCERWSSIEEITTAKGGAKATFEQQVTRVRGRLENGKTPNPTRVATLRGTIAGLFAKDIAEETISRIIELLGREGVLEVQGTTVCYRGSNSGITVPACTPEGSTDMPQPSNGMTLEEQVTAYKAWLAKMGKSRPGSLKALQNSIKAHFGKQMTSGEASRISDELVKDKTVLKTGAKDKITYAT